VEKRVREGSLTGKQRSTSKNQAQYTTAPVLLAERKKVPLAVKDSAAAIGARSGFAVTALWVSEFAAI
jgi:hypothetical protein